MKARNREVNIFNMSLLDILCGALGAFCFMMLVLFPYWKPGGAAAVDPKDLERQVQELRQKLAKAGAPTELVDQFAKLQQRYRQAAEELAQRRRELEELQRKLQQSGGMPEAEAEQLRRQLEQKQREAEALKQQMEEAARQLEELRRKLLQSSNVDPEVLKQFEQLQAQYQKLREQYQRKEREAQEFAQQAEQARKLAEEAQRRAAEIERQLEELKKRMLPPEVKQELEALRQKLAEEQQAAQQLQKQAEFFKGKAEEQRAARERAEQEAAKVRQEGQRYRIREPMTVILRWTSPSHDLDLYVPWKTNTPDKSSPAVDPNKKQFPNFTGDEASDCNGGPCSDVWTLRDMPPGSEYDLFVKFLSGGGNPEPPRLMPISILHRGKLIRLPAPALNAEKSAKLIANIKVGPDLTLKVTPEAEFAEAFAALNAPPPVSTEEKK